MRRIVSRVEKGMAFSFLGSVSCNSMDIRDPLRFARNTASRSCLPSSTRTCMLERGARNQNMPFSQPQSGKPSRS